MPNSSFKRYFQIDHKILFLFGYFFYFLTPIIVGRTHAFDGYPGMDLFHGFYKQIPSGQLNAYIIITLSWLPAFYGGHLLFKLLRPYKKELIKFPASYTTDKISLVSIALIFVLIAFAYTARNSFVGDYSSYYDSGARGKISTLLVTFNFLLLYQLVSKQSISIVLITGTVITAILLLAIGGRMYVIQTIIIILIYKTSFADKKWKFHQITLVLFAGFIVGSTIGLARMKSNINLDKAQYSLFAEPVFTWFSTSTFLIYNKIPRYNFPMNFLTSFVNLFPNSIISLQKYVITIKGMGYHYLNPLGADSIWSTIVVNFGSIGSFFFIFLTGFMLNFLRHLAEDRRFWAVYYICVCAMLPFQIFRDGFYIINKQLFFNFMLFPAIILLILKLIEFSQKPYKTESKEKSIE